MNTSATVEADDVPVSVLIKRKQQEGETPKHATGTQVVEELPEWWDDSLSIVVLMERRAAFLQEQAKRKMEAIRLTAKEKEASKPAKKERKESSGGGSGAGSSSSSEKSRPSGSNKAAEFYDTKKGQILQTLLVRWWYSYDWPTPSEIGTPPPGYEEMDGFPGVFVSMNLESLGQVLDLRDKKNCPSLKNLSKRHTKDLKEMCVEALSNQLKQLHEFEGEDAPLSLKIKRTLKEVRGIDVEEAESEAKKKGGLF
jgi:hypothetical protein